jgi:hypothetical protein
MVQQLAARTVEGEEENPLERCSVCKLLTFERTFLREQNAPSVY